MNLRDVAESLRHEAEYLNNTAGPYGLNRLTVDEWLQLLAQSKAAALLTRQEALLDVKRIAAALVYADEGGSVAEDWELWAASIREFLLDASQSVKPPVLPEPDLRLMGEAVKGGKYPEQPVKP